jgi:hypothetical protein
MPRPSGVIPERPPSRDTRAAFGDTGATFRDDRATIGDTGATFRDNGATKIAIAPAKTAGFWRTNSSNLMNLNNKAPLLLPSRFAREAIT